MVTAMPIDDSFGALGNNSRIAGNADQAEKMAMGKQTSSVSRSLLDERISGELEGDFDEDRVIGDGPVEEELAGSTLEILEHRKELLGSAYPFDIDRQLLSYTGTGKGVYEFCLDLSLMDHSHNQNAVDVVLFELMAAKIVAGVFRGEHFRSGWPSHDKKLRPSKLKQVAKIMEEKTGEWWWMPSPGNPQDPNSRDTKDEGMDFLVWKRLDSRNGSFFVAGQCACGGDWRNKFEDLTPRKINRWWAFPSFVPFTASLAIPYAVPGQIAIQDVSRRAGLVFDRVRLTLAAQADEPPGGWGSWLDSTRTTVAKTVKNPVAKDAGTPKKSASKKAAKNGAKKATTKNATTKATKAATKKDTAGAGDTIGNKAVAKKTASSSKRTRARTKTA